MKPLEHILHEYEWLVRYAKKHKQPPPPPWEHYPKNPAYTPAEKPSRGGRPVTSGTGGKGVSPNPLLGVRLPPEVLAEVLERGGSAWVRSLILEALA